MDEMVDGVEFEFELGGEASVELNSEWVAWLEGEPVPSNVEGVEDGDGGYALA